MRKNTISDLSMAKSGGKQLFAVSLLVAFTLCNSWLHAQDADWQNEDPADVLADVLTEATQAAVAASVNAPGSVSPATDAPPPVENLLENNPSEQNDSAATPVSNTSFTSLIERIEALEVAADSQKQFPDGVAEIEIIKKPTIKIFGRAMLDYWAFPSNSRLVNWVGQPNTTAPFSNTNPKAFIGFRRLRLGAKGQASENMEYKLQMEFAQPDQVTFKDAYLGWLNLPWNDKILIGNQKRPYGLAHLDSSRYMVFMERPYVVDAFNNDARRLGVEAYGYSDDERWNWRYGGFDMQNIAKVGRIYNNQFEPEAAGRIANTIWYDEMSGGRGYAHWALSGAVCFPNGGPTARFRTRPEAYSQTSWFDTGQITNGESYQLGGVEGVINVNQLSVVGEYMGVTMQRTGATNLNFHGGYVYVAYWLTNDYSPWNRQRGVLGRTKPNENFFIVQTDKGRQRGWGAWQIAGRLSRGDFSDQGIDGGVGQSFSFALNWWWNPNARLQFNYINGAISQRNTNNSGGGPGGNQIANNVPTSGSYNCFGTQFMIDW
jgi:phosphate-selective porin OprO/OprP